MLGDRALTLGTGDLLVDKAVFREVDLQRNEEQYVAALEREMRKCARYLRWFCVSEALLTVVHWRQGETLHVLTGLAECMNKSVAASLVQTGSVRLRKVYTTRGNDIHYLLRGLLQLGRVFQELSILSAATGLLQVAAAAAMWQSVTYLVALVLVVVTALRVAAWHYPQTMRRAHQRLSRGVDRLRWAVRRRLAPLKERVDRLQALALGDGEDHSSDLSGDVDIDYEFTRRQEQVVRRLVQGMHTFNLATLLSGASEALLFASHVHLGRPAHALSNVFDLADDVAVSTCLSRAYGSFDKVLAQQGDQDLANVLEGLGEEAGLARLFRRVGQITLLVTLAQLAEAILPVLVHVLFGTKVHDSLLESIRVALDVVWG